MKVFQCFDGNVSRISRFDYWLAYAGVFLFFGFVDILILCGWQTFGYWKQFLAVEIGIKLFQIVYMYLLTLKRFHDVGYATWCLNVCVLLSFVVIGSILIFIVVLSKSDGDNAWGNNLDIRKQRGTQLFT